jgi:hypothetical protein
MYQDLRQLEQEEYNLLENTEEWSDGTGMYNNNKIYLV